MTAGSVVERFARQAAETPDALALAGAGGAATYGDILRASTELAGRIRAALGSSSAARVAILADHSPAAVVLFLAVLRSGACAVPISPHESDEYLGFVFDDAGVQAVVADDANLARARDVARGRETLGIGGPNDVAPAGTVFDDPASDAPAAIVYTSGSTGRPKGVVTPHRNLDRRVRQYEAVSGLGPGDRQASFIPAHFAAAFPDVFGPLVRGATVLPLDLRRHDPSDLLDWTRRNAVTHLNVPIALLRRLLASGAADAPLAAVRLVNLSGDRLAPDDLRALFRLLPEGAAVLYGYGSTETNLVAQRLLTRDALEGLDDAGGAVPVGRPVEGKTVLLLGDDGVARGTSEGSCEGEVLVGGAFVAPGYWNRPDATREAFVELEAGRFYRTGDRGRLLEDGSLAILGRIGSRVKVRGRRVDLAAVETVLRSLDGVREAAADVRPGPDGEPRLVAWVVPAGDSSVTAAAVRREVRARAPSHWVPSRVAVLPSLPLTASGKVDRRALEDPAALPRPSVDPSGRPRSDLERRLAALFAAALDVDEVSVLERYFDLGGDSLALAGIFAAVEREWGVSVPAASISDDLTVRSLAEWLERPEPRSERSPSPGAPPRFAPRRGSLVHGPYAGDRVLPYSLGLLVQRSVLARPWVQRRWFSERVALVTRWHGRLSVREPLSTTILRSLLSNTWVEWRARALARPATFARFVDVEGEHHLIEALASGRGAVLVVPHTGLRHARLLRTLPSLAGRPVASIHRGARRRSERELPERIAQRAEQLHRARAVLLSGGVAVIAGDGHHGTAGLDVPFLGRPRRFRFGAADLAERTGAALLPTHATLDPSGRVRVAFHGPLETRAVSPEDRVEDLTRELALHLETHWPLLLGSLRWGRLEE